MICSTLNILKALTRASFSLGCSEKESIAAKPLSPMPFKFDTGISRFIIAFPAKAEAIFGSRVAERKPSTSMYSFMLSTTSSISFSVNVHPLYSFYCSVLILVFFFWKMAFLCRWYKDRMLQNMCENGNLK